MPKEEKDPQPLNAQEMKFATMFVRFRDIYKAAERAHVPRSQAVKVFNKPSVQDEIDRQMETVREERARQQVIAENLTNELLDKEMITFLSDPKTAPSLKLDALRLGYVVTGRIQAGSTKLLETAPGDDDRTAGGGFSYRAMVNVQPAASAAAAAAAPILPLAEAAEAAAPAQPEPAPPAAKPTAKPAAAPLPQKPATPRRDGPETIKLG